MFDSHTVKDFSDLYSIKIKNNELWIKNINNEKDKYFINISNIDLKDMNANNIKIIYISENDNYYYSAKNGKILNNIFNLENVIVLNLNNDEYTQKKILELELNFDSNNLIDSISNFKYIPFYKYKKTFSFFKKI